MMLRHWIFDFDGTLVDSAPAILQAYATALSEVGLAPQVGLTNQLIGPPLTETLRLVSGSTDPSLIQTLGERFKSLYDRDGVANTPAYPGVEQLLERLLNEGASLHIATNKRLSVTQAILNHLGWGRHFASVYALDMCEPRLPNKSLMLQKQIRELGLTAQQACYIGDKNEDGLAATANGLSFRYASWGYGNLTPSTIPSEWAWVKSPHYLLQDLLPLHEASQP